MDEDTFYYMSSLTDLHLGNNRLATLPDLSYTRLLITLDLSNNQFVTFSNELDSLTRLVSIDLSGNQISSLPSTFFKYNTKLQNIDLSNNDL